MKKGTFKVSQELKDTVLADPKKTKVYFDASGRHYFYVHHIATKERGEEMSDFGQGKFSHKQVIQGEGNIDKIKEDISYGDASTEIVGYMDRNDVLSAPVDSTGKKEQLFEAISNMTPEEKAQFAQLFAAPVAKEEEEIKPASKPAAAKPTN